MRWMTIGLLTAACLLSGCSSSPGLRGEATTAVACPTNPDAKPTANQDALTDDVVALTICPTLPARPDDRPVVVTPVDGARFTDLVTALSLADEGPRLGQACDASLALPLFVFARTTRGVWLLHIPTDSCSHFSPELQSALQAAREH